MKNNVIKRNSTNIKYLNKKTGKVRVIFRDVLYGNNWTVIDNGELYVTSITHLRIPELFEIIEQGVPEGVAEMKEQIKKLENEINFNFDSEKYDMLSELRDKVHSKIKKYYEEMLRTETAA